MTKVAPVLISSDYVVNLRDRVHDLTRELFEEITTLRSEASAALTLANQLAEQSERLRNASCRTIGRAQRIEDAAFDLIGRVLPPSDEQ